MNTLPSEERQGRRNIGLPETGEDERRKMMTRQREFICRQKIYCVYYEEGKRELKRKLIHECRCNNERLKAKAEGSSSPHTVTAPYFFEKKKKKKKKIREKRGCSGHE